MHEMVIAKQIIEIATSSIPDSMKNRSVERVNLKVGKLSSVVPDSLIFCFEILSIDTRLAGAELNIEVVPVLARCRECETEWTINEPIFTCKKCKSGLIEIISGRELNITSIELEDSKQF
ncbi:MAG: hydrogenase maturation nickel metallochaperone HypA [Thermodesulfobacteriota bacterium]|nr:hydrogenase maturation nickel metallochaperone HypA [Thermodesulfobacteriota bacterium]